MTSYHEESGNGKSPCIHEDDFVRIDDEMQKHEQRATREFVGVFATISRVETKVDRMLEGLRIGQIVRAPSPSLDWELDEPTMTGREDPNRAASMWAERAREAAERLDAMQSELIAAKTATAAAMARCEERSRHSDRAHAHSIARWKLITGLIVTVLTSGAVTAFLANLLSGR